MLDKIDLYATTLLATVSVIMILYGYYEDSLPFKIYGLLSLALVISHIVWMLREGRTDVE